MSKMQRKNGINKLLERIPPEIEENEEILLLYNCIIPTGITVTHNRPDIVVKDKKKQKCYIIEVGISDDRNLMAYERRREWNKISKPQAWNPKNVRDQWC